MARSRNIKPGLFKNEVLGVADPLYTLLFEGLWLLADREGRLEDRPLRIKGEVFPYRDGLDMNAMLDWLQANGFIRRYTAAGKKCIFIVEFRKHQNPHKNETESELPAPESEGSDSDEIGTTSEKIGSAPADSLSSDSLIPDSGLLGVGASPKAPPAARGTSLSKDWAPTSEQISFCRNERPDLDPSLVASRFRDYWIAIAGAKGRKLDWDATWRNWVRNEKSVQARASPGSYAQHRDQQRDETIAILTGRRPNERTTDAIDVEARPID